MPTLAFGKQFLKRYADLSKTVQKDVVNLLSKFGELSKTPSLHLEPIKGALDPNVRTIRVNQGVRGIVAAPESGDTFILIDVLPHDDAIQWCLRKKLQVNQVTGALEVYDVVHETHPVAEEPAVEAPFATPYGFLSDRSDAEFTQVGIDPLFLPAIRALKNEGELLSLAGHLPADQGQALAMLAAGYPVDDILAELLGGLEAEPIDRADIAAAVQRPASGTAFYVVESAADLAELLNQPLEHWRVFLHPRQRRYAYRPVFSGPARVLGGPGTGKTVVALHRARFLADRLPAGRGRRILLTTFTRNLAQALSEQLIRLSGDPSILERVDVVNLDKLAYSQVKAKEKYVGEIISEGELRVLFEDAAAAHAVPHGPDFLRREWEQVILAQGITTRDDYFRASRAGRGIRLSRGQRDRVWTAVRHAVDHLGEIGARTHLQIAYDAAKYAEAVPSRYEHVIVDEAQDFHPAQWRLLRALVAPGPNDLFIVGDAHQRIYDNRVSLFSLGIDVRGRGSKLRLNYRTTYENLRWSIGLLEGTRYDDLDGSADDLNGYRSQLHGPVPTATGYQTPEAERDGLAQAIAGWIEAGVRAEEIGVAVRTTDERNAVIQALNHRGIPAEELSASGVAEGAAVQVATMHGMKGLEFRCLAVAGVREGAVPLSAALTPREDDELQHAYDMARERSLLFVACTRARDWLRVSWSGQASPFLAALQ